MSIIVIEGADNIGKTTIAKYLVEQLNYQYYHCSVPISEDSAKNEYFSLIERDNIILDRSWIGEFVYAPLFRNYLPNYRDEIKTRLKEKSILLILLHCNKNKLKDLKYINSNEFLNKHEEISNKFLEEFAKIKYGQKVIFNIENFSSLEEEKLIIKNFVHNWIININTYKDFINNYSLTMFNPSFRFLNGNIEDGLNIWLLPLSSPPRGEGRVRGFHSPLCRLDIHVSFPLPSPTSTLRPLPYRFFSFG